MSRSCFLFGGWLVVAQLCFGCEGEIGDSEGTWPMATESQLPGDASGAGARDAQAAEVSETSGSGETEGGPDASPSAGDTGSDSGTVAPVCGNGVVERGETCDDATDAGSCRDCQIVPEAVCGDGVVDVSEECDSTSEACVGCRLAFCGDGEVQGDEECDDGNSVDGDECDNHCTIHRCGDGVLQSGEQCDPPGERCTTTCESVPENCGDGFVQTAEGEQCDDPNDIPGDGCYQCKLECGNGIVERAFGEACEAGRIFMDCKTAYAERCVRCSDAELGNAQACERRDVCDAECQWNAACGDGRLDQAAGEECEPPGSVTCSASCETQTPPPAECGNGKRETGEQCDPPDGRFCGATCMHVACGNGTREGAEECDPPNGDTCDADCRVVGACVPQQDDGPPLLGDGSFAESIGVWRSDVPSQAQVSHEAAMGVSSPGALEVQLSRGDFTGSSTHVLGASMCVPVAANTVYDFSGSYTFEAGTPTTAGTSVSLFVYGNATCTGSPIEPARSRGARMLASQTWKPYGMTLDTGVGAPDVPLLSVRVRLDVWRPTDVDVVKMYWDDVELVARGSGNGSGTDGYCGDCVVQEDEQCDDGNQLDGDGCSQTCIEECAACQQDQCSAQYDACVGLTIPGHELATAGPGVGEPLGELCGALAECAWRTGCAGETAVSTLDGLAGSGVTGMENCYCGTAGTACFEAGRANGSCKAEVEAALESVDPALIFSRMGGSNSSFPGFSAAVALVDCGIPACAAECGPGVSSQGERCGNGTLEDRDATFLATFTPGTFDSVGGDSVATCGELADGMCFPELGCGCFFEECDDGNSAAGDGCDEHCFVERCGNGVRQPSEECDDGNETDGDGCSAACLVEWTCGDGVNEGNEACDDGNTTLNDGCDDRCQVEECGNGVTQSHLGEECDPPNGTTCVADCKLPGRDTCTECVLRASLDIYDLAAYGLDLTTCVGNLILNEWPAGIGGRPDALTCLEDASCVALWNCYARTGCIRGASGIEGTCYCGTGDEWGSTCLSNDNYEATGLCVNEMKAAYTAQYGLPATNTSLLEDFVNPEGAFVGTSSALYLASVAAKSCLEFAEPQRSNDGSIWSFGTLDLGLCLAGVPRSERSECSQACFGDDAGRVLNDDCSALE